MSLNTAGMRQKSITMSVTTRVLSTDFLIKLSNEISREDIFHIMDSDLKNTTKGYWLLGRPLYVRVHIGVFILQSLYKWTDRQAEEFILSTKLFKSFRTCKLNVKQSRVTHYHYKTMYLYTFFKWHSKLTPINLTGLANSKI